MSKIVFLHVGMHKTGTSALQSALVNYDDGDTFYARFEERNHSIPIYTAFSAAPTAYRTLQARGLDEATILARRERYRNRLAAELSRNDRAGLIIVGEDIGKIDAEGQKALVEFIRARGWTLRVFCYMRSPESFAASALQQRIKFGLATIPYRFEPNYRKRINVFVEMLGAENLCVRLYDRERLINGNIVDDFCAHVGIKPPATGGKDANESLSLDALRLVFALNQSNPCCSGDGALAEARNAFVAEIGRTYPSTNKLSPTLFAGRVDRSDEPYLSDTFGIDFRRHDRQLDVEVEDVLSDLDSVDLAPLARRLDAPFDRSGDAVWLINRLFYRHVGTADSLRSATSKGLKLLLRAALRRVRRWQQQA